MSGQNFIDHVRIYCKSGDGGAGAVHFRREKYVSKGGPDGGDGGRGGHIWLRASVHLNTLLHLRYRKHIRATSGQSGSKNKRTGKEGADTYLEVPLGTVAKHENGEIIGEVTQENEQLLLLKGGRGGRGNVHFCTSTRQAPDFSEEGKEGKEALLTLELKLLADAGLVGYPNAGKSTLLRKMSAALPKVGAYPFTTLHPTLGVVQVDEYHSFVLADLPGIIQGAAQGKGLGLRFLRHIERNQILVFVISAEDPIHTTYTTLREELRSYDLLLDEKKHVLVISKSDLLNPQDYTEKKREIPPKIPCYFISSWQEKGINTFKHALWKILEID